MQLTQFWLKMYFCVWLLPLRLSMMEDVTVDFVGGRWYHRARSSSREDCIKCRGRQILDKARGEAKEDGTSSIKRRGGSVKKWREWHVWKKRINQNKGKRKEWTQAWVFLSKEESRQISFLQEIRGQIRFHSYYLAGSRSKTSSYRFMLRYFGNSCETWMIDSCWTGEKGCVVLRAVTLHYVR